MGKGAVTLGIIVLTAGTVSAQKVENVQVLPFKEKKEISQFMKKKVAKSLGVKCKFCHNLKDYASDENPHKVVAREMMRMMLSINEQLTSIQQVAQEAGMEHWDEPPKLDCWACHRGSTRPEYSAPE
ncbi:MAG: c-type cytochrome [Fidelibacterota bacterium]